MTIKEIKKIASPACREFGVKRLDLFGSLSRGKGTAISDVDLIVEFEDPTILPSKRFFGLLHHPILRTVFGCRRFFEINKLDEARCFIFNLGLHPEFDKKTGRSINLCFIET